ncbi:MAG: FAD-dependent monooxygenase [Actinomycetia bacterium]|nr:FAD-dependent monooxygenase [Actinomycetes bacterium]MCH9699954.1 FAD-dependent monooxygenase [Actinomycetes bacterium]MCH9761687.1 FAD-dependent monooxygenase [Actinomycetes bacterium]
MPRTQVLIIGAGPVGLVSALLLSQHGISSIVIDSKSAFSDHPRARFFDSITLELFRQLGFAREVEAIGLDSPWTESVTVAETFAGTQIAKIPGGEFYSVPRPISSQIPVMSSQDLLEPILYAHAMRCADTRVWLSHECLDLVQDGDRCRARVKKVDTGEEIEICSDYVIGADGARSTVRRAIGARLDGEVRDTFYRDVLFHADMRRWVDDLDQRGAVLFVSHDKGAGMFVPLDGRQRWRIQIAGIDPNRDITDEEVREWIWSGVGAGERFPIDVDSKLIWRVSGRVADRYRVGRVMLVGDAAHVFSPTGGMGLNAGFAGCHNLMWKLAYVIKGVAPDWILDTYGQEWRLQAQRRTKQALENHDFMGALFMAHFGRGNVARAYEDVLQYTNYAGLIFGYEHASALCLPDSCASPAAETNQTYVPVVRSGRRAPHFWVDEANNQALSDWFGSEYVVLTGPGADAPAWREAVGALSNRGFPIRIEQLTGVAGSVYADEAVVVVRPDCIVAAQVRNGEVVNAGELLQNILPLTARSRG